jgi:FAD/FMN-containing dehydrogenase
MPTVEVLTNGAAYENARKPRIARFHDVRPAAIVRCGSAHDVADAIAYAREHSLGIAIRSGGHCFGGRSSTTGLLIDVSRLDEISVDAETVTVGAGARLAQIYDALAPDRTIAGGCGPTVGIAGLALGGGLGVLGRRYGLTCDQVVGAQLVRADGAIVAADDELLWALKGAGGGQFGVVTELTLRTVPAPPTTCFHQRFPFEQAAALIDWWQRSAPDAPDATAASLVVRPDAVHLFGVGDMKADVRVELPFREAKQWLADNGPPEQPEEHALSKSEYFRDLLPTATIEQLVAHFAGGAGTRELDFSPWGGAYNRPAPDATAFPHRRERFLLKQTGQREWLQRSYEITHPHGTGGAYINFPDHDLSDWRTAYYGDNQERLARIKRAYDPENVFRFAQSL